MLKKRLRRVLKRLWRKETREEPPKIESQEEPEEHSKGDRKEPAWWHMSAYACCNVIQMPVPLAESVDGEEIYHPEFGECIAQQHSVLKDAVTLVPKSMIKETDEEGI